LNTTVTTVNSRIKKLIKSGVISVYGIDVDWPKIGYQWYKADIVLKDPEKRQKIVGYIENNPNLLFKILSLGYVDLELAFTLNNINQLHQIMEDLSMKIPDSIRNYKYFSVTKTHKFEGVDFWNR
jgi:DNA-binding Lrp family transcriptional regulator